MKRTALRGLRPQFPVIASLDAAARPSALAGVILVQEITTATGFLGLGNGLAVLAAGAAYPCLRRARIRAHAASPRNAHE